LKEGRNRISFTQYAPNKGVSIKEFKLKPVKASGGPAAKLRHESHPQGLNSQLKSTETTPLRTS